MLFGCGEFGIVNLVLGLTYRAGIKGLPVLLITPVHDRVLRTFPRSCDLGSISEIFPNRVRGIGVSISVSACGALRLF